MAEARIVEGGEEVADFLTQEILPGALRERLMQRP
jgi:hypothetical protein